MVGHSQMQRADCIHCSTPFYVGTWAPMDLGICRRSWNQLPCRIRGMVKFLGSQQLYVGAMGGGVGGALKLHIVQGSTICGNYTRVTYTFSYNKLLLWVKSFIADLGKNGRKVSWVTEATLLREKLWEKSHLVILSFSLALTQIRHLTFDFTLFNHLKCTIHFTGKRCRNKLSHTNHLHFKI